MVTLNIVSDSVAYKNSVIDCMDFGIFVLSVLFVVLRTPIRSIGKRAFQKVSFQKISVIVSFNAVFVEKHAFCEA